MHIVSVANSSSAVSNGNDTRLTFTLSPLCSVALKKKKKKPQNKAQKNTGREGEDVHKLFKTDVLSQSGGDKDKLATERAGDASTAPDPQTPISRLITRLIEADACQSAPKKGERQEGAGVAVPGMLKEQEAVPGELYRGTDP